MSIVLLVLFVMTMFLWALTLLGAVAIGGSGWLAFFACLFLGAAVFWIGRGTLIIKQG